TFNNPPNNTDLPDPLQNPGAISLSIFQCPSSPSRGAVYQDTWSQASPGSCQSAGPYTGSPTWTVSVSDYIACSGVTGAAWGPYMPTGYNMNEEEGILNDNYYVRASMISDGLSNTWMVGEVSGAPNIWLHGPVLVSQPPYPDANNWCISGNAWA